MIRDGLPFEHATVNQKLVTDTLHERTLRFDGRALSDARSLDLTLFRFEAAASAELQQGKTRVLAHVNAELSAPFPNRNTEGFLSFNVEFSPMASSSFEVGKPAPEAVQLSRLIERSVRDSQAIDTEALCVVAAEWVWSIKVQVTVLDCDGNLVDACALAAMAALQHLRRPAVTVLEPEGGEETSAGQDGGSRVRHSAVEVKVEHSDDKDPTPLALHHVPICATFAILSSAPTTTKGVVNTLQEPWLLLDPSAREEVVSKGSLTLALTAQGEICTIHKLGGLAMSPGLLLESTRRAWAHVSPVHDWLANELKMADKKAADERTARLRGRHFKDMEVSKDLDAAYVTESASSKIQHLQYDDLHVTFKTREDDEDKE